MSELIMDLAMIKKFEVEFIHYYPYFYSCVPLTLFWSTLGNCKTKGRNSQTMQQCRNVNTYKL